MHNWKDICTRRLVGKLTQCIDLGTEGEIQENPDSNVEINNVLDKLEAENDELKVGNNPTKNIHYLKHSKKYQYKAKAIVKIFEEEVQS